MKLAVLADTHMGVRGNSDVFHDNMEKFYSNVFFPYLKENRIVTIIHAGDIFDERKKIDMHTAKRAREYFFDPLSENKDMYMFVAAGNHDLYYRHSSDTTALKEILGLYPNIQFMTEVTDRNIHGLNICFIPWIHNENRERSLTAIKNSKAPIAFGHLELTGYQMYKGQISKHGEDPSIFEKFEHVYSGHFHHKNSRNNITYLGSVSQHIWTDWGDVRGFHVFDTETHEMTFVANPYDMFAVIDYDSNVDIDFNTYSGMYVRVQHGELESQAKFNSFIKQLSSAGVANLQIIPKHIEKRTHISNNGEQVTVDDTETIIRNNSSDELQSYLLELHKKALLCA